MMQAKPKARERISPVTIVEREFFTPQERDTVAKIAAAMDELKAYFVEREDVIEMMAVMKICKQHVVELGPPGTAKSYIIECFCKYFAGVVFFQWQFNKFTTPDEVFGHYSIPELQKGNFKRVTAGKFSECNVFYGDEIFNANTSILNAMNQGMNERVFEGKHIDLENVYAATNFYPEEKSLVAFFDRFLGRLIVDDIHESANFEQMLVSKPYVSSNWGTISRDEMAALQAKISGVDAKQVIPIISKIRELLRIEHVEPSSRRFKWALQALQARAILSGREFCTQEDVWLLRNILWTDPKEIPVVEAVITKAIDPDMARIKIFYDQAIDIKKQLAPLDMKDAAANQAVAEGTQKLVQIADSIKEMREKVVMMPRVQAVAEKLEKAVREIHKEILKTKLGVAM